MSITVTVLRVFTDPAGNFGNPLGVVDAARVAPADRQDLAAQLGYSETIFVDLPPAGATTAHVTIYTPGTEIPFAGHPTVGPRGGCANGARRSTRCRCRPASSR